MPLSRRRLIALTAAAAAMQPACLLAASSSAAIKFMKTVARDLMAAQRDGSEGAYYDMVTRHADLPAISMYALGQYQGRLPKARRPDYFRGVAGFMSRYFADQSKQYQVVDADFAPATRQDGEYTLVESKLTLASGQTYNVSWRLVARRSGFRIADVTVLGFSMTYLQQRIFLGYIAKKGGDVMALVNALTR